MTLTPEQLAEARALVEKATAVSWTANHGSWNSNVTFTQPNPVFEGESVTGLVIQSVGRDNATFIAASRLLIPALLDDVTALREGLREALELLDRWVPHQRMQIDALRRRVEVER